MRKASRWVAPLLAALTITLPVLGDEPSPPPPPAAQPPTAPPPSMEINLLNPPGTPSDQPEPEPEIKPDLEKSAELNQTPPPAPEAAPSPEAKPEKKAEAAPPPAPEVSPVPKEAQAVPSPTPTPLTEATPQPVAPPPEQTAPPPKEEHMVTVSHPRRDLRIPAYTLTRPQWGVEVIGSAKALGGHDLVPGQNGVPTQGIGLQFEYQPKFIQSVGVLGIGPTFMLYPISADAGVTPNVISLYSVGGQVRYQLRYFREQPFVPLVGYEVHYLEYAFNSGAKGSLVTTGPFYGIWILLNYFEPSVAAESYVENGVSRTYLVAELHPLQGANSDLTISGTSAFFGLRFEF